MVRELRAELGTRHGTVTRVATELDYGTGSVRLWVRQADLLNASGGERPNSTPRVAELEKEVRELKKANEILTRVAVLFGAEVERCRQLIEPAV